jgi:Mg/Co/Ni transporter MgtE
MMNKEQIDAARKLADAARDRVYQSLSDAEMGHALADLVDSLATALKQARHKSENAQAIHEMTERNNAYLSDKAARLQAERELVLDGIDNAMHLLHVVQAPSFQVSMAIAALDGIRAALQADPRKSDV